MNRKYDQRAGLKTGRKDIYIYNEKDIFGISATRFLVRRPRRRGQGEGASARN